MKIYIVENVRPDMQAFDSYEKAFAFAKEKADRRKPAAIVGYEPLGAKFSEIIYNPIPWSDSHINIYERELN